MMEPWMGKDWKPNGCLTTLDAGESTELEYAVQLPADFENAFSLEADLMTWKLKAEPNRAVQTGDDFSILWTICNSHWSRSRNSASEPERKKGGRNE